ncbi:CDF family Co(II)/Ni(II) efflux transporter DmeF [Rivibacter subsaxonicus]|uniref:Cation diffusion facilitator family transporter n=1 Tax=Rivibacter subsaxonicus TaxID=457575 RepID=A0A4Q7VG65_9BURK|nr:CDF family Co(II)/Ni(II) efflux transporter DmeF [Rivibacter subsaxonicus]RZT94984.1 cation diffusion facilitator family transporter [Rivibacter subsaxonicus]
MSTPHSHDLSRWQHRHDYAPDRSRSERRTRWVVALTLVMMVAEIAAGWWSNSMALLADGWHMGTHAVAIGVTALSYALARRWAGDARFSLGTGKIEVLGAYTSALLLVVVALAVGVESVLRLYEPRPIGVNEALAVAVVGLIVNLVCARLLHHGDHGHDHGHAHDHAGHEHEHDHAPAHKHHEHHADHDLNLRAAYLHVVADAATSVLAIGALLAAKWFGWLWADALVGLLGAALILHWARGLLAQSATILLDREMDHPLAAQVRERIEADGDTRVADLHLTRVGGDRFALQLTLVAERPADADAYRARLADLPSLAHAGIEVHRCPTCNER